MTIKITCGIKRILVCTLISLAGYSVDVYAQAGKDYATYPYWIRMMKDTNTNYFEAVKAFNMYWKGREKPEEENEKFANAGNEADKEKSKNIPYSFEYKKFKNWQMLTKPYVQNDGSILFPYQRRQLSYNSRHANPVNTNK